MKKLFASASYSFNNFYDNLNARGQIVFMVIIILIGILVLILMMSYIAQWIKNRKRIKNVLIENKKAREKIETNEKKVETNIISEDDKSTNEISTIASEIEKALSEEKNIDLTAFEEDQEKTAIISIDELIARAKELEIIEDEQTGVNYMEKYNLEPAEVNEKIDNITEKKSDSTPIKSFKVSQVISPVYGVKKEVINNDRF